MNNFEILQRILEFLPIIPYWIQFQNVSKQWKLKWTTQSRSSYPATLTLTELNFLKVEQRPFRKALISAIRNFKPLTYCMQIIDLTALSVAQSVVIVTHATLVEMGKTMHQLRILKLMSAPSRGLEEILICCKHIQVLDVIVADRVLLKGTWKSSLVDIEIPLRNMYLLQARMIDPHSISSYLRFNAHHLRSLCITESHGSGSGLLQTIALHCTQIQEIILCACGPISQTAVNALLQVATSLEWLDLSYCSGFHTFPQDMVANGLHTVKVNNCDIDNTCLERLGIYCPKLKLIEMQRCKNLSDQGILDFVASTSIRTAISFNFTSTLISDISIKALESKFNALKLNLESCRGVSRPIRQNFAMEQDLEIKVKLIELKLKQKEKVIEELIVENEQLKVKYEQSTNASNDSFLRLLHLPLKIIELKNEVENGHLFNVHQEWQKLVVWRNVVFEKYTMGSSILNNSEILAHHFESLDGLGTLLCDTIWRRIKNSFDHTDELSDCLRIIRDGDSLGDSKEDSLLKSAMMQLHCANSDNGLFIYTSLTRRLQRELKLATHQYCTHLFQRLIEPEVDKIVEVEDADVCKKSYVIGNVISTYFPEETSCASILDEFYDGVVQVLEIKVEGFLSSMEMLDIYGIFRIVNWIDAVKRDANTLSMNKMHSLLKTMDEKFTDAYIGAIQKQVMQASARIVRRTYGVRIDTKEEWLFTDAVEEIILYITDQVDFLKSSLRSHRRLRESVHLCLAILQTRQQYQHDDLISINNCNLDSLPPSYLEHMCAIVNDNYRIQNDMMEIYFSCADALQNDHEREALENYMHEIAHGFNNVVDEAVRAICVMIFRDLSEIMQVFFTERWLLGSATPILMLLSTVDDYLGDIVKFTKHQQHAEMVRTRCVEMFIRQYVERLASGVQYFQVDDMEIVSNKIHDDAESIREYTSQQVKRQKQFKVPNSVLIDVQHIDILDIIAQFFTYADPTTVYGELAKECGKSTVQLIHRLLALRVDLSESDIAAYTADLTDFENWATHNAPSTARFYVIPSTPIAQPSKYKPSITSDQVQQKASALLAKAKRTSIVKGVASAASSSKKRFPFPKKKG